MSDIAGQESTQEAPEVTSEEQVEDHSSGQESEANPFWGEVEKLTGPNVYKTIQPHLAKADTAARQRVEAVNQSYAPWKAFADRGVTPDHVEQALGVVQQLNTSPEQVFESLRSFLEREGRLPSNAELKKEVAEDEAEDNDESESEIDRKLKQLADQQQSIQDFLAQQQQSALDQREAAEADTWLKSEVERLSDPKYGYDRADIEEIIRIAAFTTQSTGQDPENLDAAAAQYNALRDRIRTTPRPGQLAPRIPSGPGGGTPTDAVNPSKLTKEQRRELVSQMLSNK